MPAGVKKKQRRRHRNAEPDSVTARFITDSSSDSDFEVRIPHVKYSDYKKKSRGCTSTERSLCAVIVVFIVVCVVLAALLVVQFVLRVGAFSKQTCTSPTCVEVAGKFLTKMDLATDPCKDFYQYSCGRWIDSFNMPPDKSRYTMFTDVSERNSARVRELLVKNGSQLLGQDSTAIRKVKDMYEACIDIKSVETRGITPMLELIKVQGPWTLTSGESGTWDPTNWNLLTRIVNVHIRGSGPLFDMSVGEDLRNVDEHIIQFDQSGLSFDDRSFYLDESISDRYYKAFREYFSTVAVLLGADNTTSYQVADDIWQLEKRIANITTPPEDRQDMEKLYHKMTLGELQNSIGSWIDLAEYLQLMFGYGIKSSSEIVVYEVDFMRRIGDIVKDTKTSTLANYFVWHGMGGGIAYLPFPFRQSQLGLREALYGVSARPAEWKECVSHATSNMPQATGALFVEKYFSANDKEKVLDILDMIKAEFRGKLATLEWMDDLTKKRAIEKVDAVRNMIGYPEMSKDPPQLDQYYEKMVITDDNSFTNWKNIIEYYVQRNLKKLPKKPDRDEWQMAPNEVNAYYSGTSNSIVFPAGILQYPFYDPTFPMAVNYGSIGMVIGHELTHGFDNSGRQYDKYGNLKKWWEPATAANFLEKAECIINQYDQFTVGNKHVKGKLTQGENIADNGGVKTAYAAYQRWLHMQGDQEDAARMPALNMTETQAFFMGFSQIWCSKVSPKYAEQALVTDVHSPPNWRVIGSLRNMQQFSDAFNCRSGAAMNARNKCTVW